MHSAFGQHFAKSGLVSPQSHRSLLDVADKRLSGDYGTGPGIPEDEAARIIAGADTFIDEIEHLLGSVPPDN